VKLLVTTDRFALESALALRADGDELLALAVGDEPRGRAFHHALAMGADRAVRVWDPLLAEAGGPGGVDELALAAVLAAVVRLEQADLVLCPAQSLARADDVTGIAAAGLLDRPHAYDVVGVERVGERLAVQRRLDGGRAELLRLTMPALLAIRTGSNAPRRPDLRAVRRAREQPIAGLGLDELGLSAEALDVSAGARVFALREHRPQRSARPIDGSPAEIAARIVELAGEGIAP
jgi:electron transfer flavoprotein beta subunit